MTMHSGSTHAGAAHTGKNIIICSDGTGNTAIKGRGTNVFKIFESVDLNGHRFDPTLAPQVAIYDDGVGTESFKLLRLFGGAFGWGLGRNVQQLYKELCRIYDAGDRIYLFGFSRGAFTARSLAGFILRCGIIDVHKLGDSETFEAAVKRAYNVYRNCYRTTLARFFRGAPDGREAAEFKAAHCHPDGLIRFVGVWDTVDAVGLPIKLADIINASIYPFKFPNLELSERVEHAAHALAIDDERKSFHPLLWDETNQHKKPHQKLEQVWFAGAHSNVGGGYPKQGMSLVALDWMMSKAEAADLRFVANDREFYHRHATVDDKLYDPRAGAGVLYRWEPRDIERMCSRANVRPKLHASVMERIAHGTEDYCPGNLPTDAIVVASQTMDKANETLAAARAAATQKVLQDSQTDGVTLLTKARLDVGVGRNSYRLFVISCLALVALAGWITTTGDIKPSYSFGYLWEIAQQVPNYVGPFLAIVSGFVGSLGLAMYCDRGMLRRFSQFWFKNQKTLRAALKSARAAVKDNRSDVLPSTEHVAVLRMTPDLTPIVSGIAPSRDASVTPSISI